MKQGHSPAAIGITLTILLGLLMPGGQGAASDAPLEFVLPPLTTPSAAIFNFSAFTIHDENPEGLPGPAIRTESINDTLGWRIRNNVTTTDQTDQERRVLEVELGAADVASPDWKGRYHMFLDPQNRSFVRIETRYGAYDVVRGEGTHAYYAPALGYEGSDASWEWYVAILQGRTLRAGDHVREMEQFQGEYSPGDSLKGPLVSRTRSSYFGEEVMIEGHRTLPLHDDSLVRWRQADGREAIDHYNQTYYFSPDAPLPITFVSQMNVFLPGAQGFYHYQNSTLVSRLASLSIGPEPIAWGPLNLGATSPPREDLEFAPELRTGTGWTHTSLDDATARVAGRPTVGLVAWRAANAANQLIGAEFNHMVPGTQQSDANLDRWDLVFGAPTAATIYVISYLHWSDGRDAVVEPPGGGLVPLVAEQRFQAADVPDQVITLGQLDRLWASSNPYAHEEGPSRVIWGYGATVRAPPLGTPPTDPWNLMRFLAVYQATAAPITDSQVNNSAVGLVVRADNGNLTYADTFTSYIDPAVELQELADFNWQGNFAGSVPAKIPASAPIRGAAIGGGIGLLALLALLIPKVRFFLWGLYARVTKPQVLENEVRNTILRLVRQDPGVSPPTLHKQTGAGLSTINYHLAVLEREGMLTSVHEGRHRRLFATGTVDASKLLGLAVLRNPMTKRAFDLIQSRPGIFRKELAENLGLTRPTVTWHMDRLVKAGLIERLVAKGAAAYRCVSEDPR